MQKRVVYGVDEYGNRVGEHHHNAKLSNEDVDWLRFLHDEGFVGYRTLARVFGVSRHTVSSIARCHRRAVTPVEYRTVCVGV